MNAARDIPTPFGPMLAMATDAGLAVLEFPRRARIEQQLSDLGRWYAEHEFAAVGPAGAHLDQIEAELGEYLAGDRTAFTVPLDMRGPDFELRVWNRLLQIPCGETTSYGRIAGDLGSPGASRAVGRANGRNRLAIIVPCHRVIAADGTLHGYGGGLERKRWLLDHERAMAGGGLFASAATTAEREG